MKPTIRPVKATDAAQLSAIYNYYITATHITFETETLTAEAMARRIAQNGGSSLPWLVIETSTGITGYAYASNWKARHAYRFSVEATIYMDVNQIGKGMGLPLYAALIDALRSLPLHSVIGGIALPNARSIRLHERLGFKKVAHFEEVGYKQKRWIDVGYWQLML